MREKYAYVKNFVMLAGFAVICLISAVNAQAANTMPIISNNNVITTNAPYIYQNNVLFLPAKDIATSLGGTFEYNNNEMTGTLKANGNELIFKLDSNVAVFNGKNITVPYGLKINNLRLLIPASFTINQLGSASYINTYRNTFLIYTKTGQITYTVMSGDTLWILSQTFGVSIDKIKNLNQLKNDFIYVGQKLIILENLSFNKTVIPGYTSNNATIFSNMSLSASSVNYLKAWTSINITGKNGDWYKAQTPAGNGYLYKSVVYINQNVATDYSVSTYFNQIIPVDASKNYINYITYTVKKSDTLWYIAEKYGVPDYEIANLNKISIDSLLYIGQALKIPIHTIPVKNTPNAKSGELLDWFSEAQYIFPIGAIGKLTDILTGKSFMIKRTMGASHSDTETLSSKDSATMKEIFGGSWNWSCRPFILEINGRRLAVSVSGMPHAGVDGVAFLKNIDNRSDNYGYGPNYDSIAGNGMNGHFDMYFLNCLRHKDYKIDPHHQRNVLFAAGLE